MSAQIQFSTPYSNDNIFAKILRGEIPNHTVIDTDECLAFMDVMPQAPGHTLVIPKAPTVTLLDLTPAQLASLMECTQRVAKAVKTALNAEGITLMQLNGSEAGQTVPHTHFHIIPGSLLKARAHATTQASPEELATMAKRISAEL